MKRLLAVIALTMGLAACGGDSVDWSKQVPGLQDRIDKKAKTADCVGLLHEWEAAKFSKDFAAGKDNADLIAYINKTRDQVGCRAAG